MSITTSPLHDGTKPAGALTTIWTPPCPDGPMTTWDSNSLESLESCMPTNYNHVYIDEGVGYYSPAICPSGYTSACRRYDRVQGPPLEPEETAVQCAPSGFTCNPDSGVSNARHVQTTDKQAPYIQVRWQASDISILETHPLTPGLKPTQTTSQGSSTTTGGGRPPATGSDSAAGQTYSETAHAMQGNTIAVIVIGSILGVFILGMAVLVFLRYGWSCSRGEKNLGSSPETSFRRALPSQEAGSQPSQSTTRGYDDSNEGTGTPYATYYSPSHIGQKPSIVGTKAQAATSTERYQNTATVSPGREAQQTQLFNTPVEMPAESTQQPPSNPSRKEIGFAAR